MQRESEREQQNEKGRGRKSFDNNKCNNNGDSEEYEIPPAYRLPQDVYSVYLPFFFFSPFFSGISYIPVFPMFGSVV